MKPPILPADTSLDAARVQATIFRRMAPARRLELALESSRLVREVVAAGVRSRYPHYTPEQINREVIRLTIGERLFRAAYPNVGK